MNTPPTMTIKYTDNGRLFDMVMFLRKLGVNPPVALLDDRQHVFIANGTWQAHNTLMVFDSNGILLQEGTDYTICNDRIQLK